MDVISFLTTFHLQNRLPILDSLMYFGADYLIYLSLILALLLALRKDSPEKKALVYFLIALPLAVFLVKLIHLFIYTDRPFITYHFNPLVFVNEDASFPSRHATILSALSFALLLAKSKFSSLFLFFLIWVGVARVYSGVHYPIDIIGGVLIGLIAAILSRLILQKMMPN